MGTSPEPKMGHVPLNFRAQTLWTHMLCVLGWNPLSGNDHFTAHAHSSVCCLPLRRNLVQINSGWGVTPYRGVVKGFKGRNEMTPLEGPF
jgi:hypothetical protein